MAGNSNIYTIEAAAERLHLSTAALLQEVQDRTIEPLQDSAAKSNRSYLFNADIIDTLAIQRENEVLRHSTAPIEFLQASETDIHEIYSLCCDLEGKQQTTSYEARLMRFRIDPHMYYILKQESILVGILIQVGLVSPAVERIMYFDDEAASATFSRIREEIVTTDTIIPIHQGLNQHIFISLGVKQGLPQSRQYGQIILKNYIALLHEYARLGIVIENLYATSKTPDGIGVCRGFRFVEAYVKSVETHRFYLDLLRAGTLQAMEYRDIVAAHHPELIPEQLHAVEVQF
jgi:hypothetical protein